MDKRIILSSVLVAAGIPLAAQHSPKHPNIIFILMDDMGYSGIKCYSSEAVASPNIDALAEDGIVCTNFHATPLSSPTRVSIMTGRYPQRAGINDIYSESDRMDGLDPATNPTFANYLRDAGYRTGIMGKWHMGRDVKFNPLNNGFDVWHGYTMGNIDFISHYNTQHEVDWWDGLEMKDEPGYVTYLINRHSTEFIRESVAMKKPFFLFMSHDAFHVPLQGPNDPPIRTATTYKYRDDERLTDEEYHRIYTDMMKAVDDGVGEIRQTLDELGIAENTMIVFISDNGGDNQMVRRYPGHNGYFRGFKFTPYEGGSHVPAIFYYPRMWGHRYCMEFANTMDLMPTFLELCRAKCPDGIDGVSMLDMLKDGTPMPQRKYFNSICGEMFEIDGDWKLIVHKNGSKELFHLFTDRNEEHDLSDVYPERAAQMEKEINQWWLDTTKGTRLEGRLSKNCQRHTNWDKK